MKSGWVTKKLGEVCEITAGNSAPQGSDNFSESGDRCFLRVADMGQLHGMTIDSTRDRLSDKPKGLRLFPSGSVVFTKSGASLLLNQRGVLARPMHVVSHIGVLIPSNEISSEYLYYWMCIVDFGRLVKPAHMPALRLSQVANLDIPIPPLAEQKRIVAKIDAAFEKIDALKANAEKNLANAKELFQSALDEAMRPKTGWVEKRLGEVCETTSGGTPIKSRPEYYEGGTIPWLRSGEVCRKDITESEMFITKLGMSNSSAKMMPKDTVLIAMYGATAAQSGILRFASTTNQAICGILPSQKFLPEFLYYYFKKIESQLAARAQGGAQPNISQQKIRETPVPVISLDLQQKIVERLNQATKCIETLQQNYARQIADCAEMRQAILREAFEGRL